ncbi:LysR family transcriptional regulator [Bacillus gobiensis]|uniref:LysR substrate-binding domain-containing protein n=1 Tax=Bacillus gobiensis TaxID=1441095 RepID=UPI003D2245EF
MNLHALRIFTEVAKSGSVTRSAENLLISQPAVTAQIRNLEKELGMRLIQSKGRSIQLTEAGQELAIHSNRLFALEGEIEKKMNDLKTGMQGSLNICTTSLPANTVLPHWIIKYKESYPLVDVKLFKSNSSSAFQRLLDYSAHVAIVCGEREEEGVDTYTLLEDELIFIVPGSHRLAGKEVSLEELMKEPFVLREEGSYTRRKLVALCESAKINEPSSFIQIEGMIESIEAVKVGYGAALVPALAVKNEQLDGKLGRVFVKDLYIKHPIKLCIRKNDEPFSPAANFISLVITELGQLESTPF